MPIETYSHQLINYIWYLEIDRDPSALECLILRHGRLHYADRPDAHPKTRGTFRLLESPSRIVQSVVITPDHRDATPITLTVTNPSHVFSYPNPLSQSLQTYGVLAMPVVSSKEAAKYTPTGTPAEHCAICQFWTIGPTSSADGLCHIVAGDIDPAGWCRYFRHCQEPA